MNYSWGLIAVAILSIGITHNIKANPYGDVLGSVIKERKELLTEAFNLTSCRALYDSARDNQWHMVGIYRDLVINNGKSGNKSLDEISEDHLLMLAEAHNSAAQVARSLTLKYCPHSINMEEIIDTKKGSKASSSMCSLKLQNYNNAAISLGVYYPGLYKEKKAYAFTEEQIRSQQAIIKMDMESIEKVEDERLQASRYLNDNCDESTYRLYNTATNKIID